MGFMDKLKDAGKQAAFGALMASQRAYGIITNGKYKLCKVGLDAHHSKLLFIKGAKLEAQCEIKEEVKSFVVTQNDPAKSYHHIELKFNDGETSDIHITVNEQTGSALPTAEERIAAHYADAALFLKSLVIHGAAAENDETKKFVNTIMTFARKEPLF